jgi:hypothetical protein
LIVAGKSVNFLVWSNFDGLGGNTLVKVTCGTLSWRSVVTDAEIMAIIIVDVTSCPIQQNSTVLDSSCDRNTVRKLQVFAIDSQFTLSNQWSLASLTLVGHSELSGVV